MTIPIVISHLPKRVKSFSKQSAFAWINAKLNRLQQARKVARQRRQLATLTSTQLRDIGISQYEADVESSRGFWDLPDHTE